MSKRYLGDGVYVDFDGFAIVVTTEDGYRATNTIVLEPEVVGALMAYALELAIAQPPAAAAVDPPADSPTEPTPRDKV